MFRVTRSEIRMFINKELHERNVFADIANGSADKRSRPHRKRFCRHSNNPAHTENGFADTQTVSPTGLHNEEMHVLVVPIDSDKKARSLRHVAIIPTILLSTHYVRKGQRNV